MTSKGKETPWQHDVEGSGTPQDPWVLKTPPGSSEFEAYRDPDAAPPALVVQVGATELRYHLRCIEDLHAMLTERGDWMPLGNADEQKPAKPDTVEAWAGPPTTRSAAGTASRRACAAASATTCRRCSRRSAWPRSSTTHATTGCERGDGQASPRLEPRRRQHRGTDHTRMVWGDSMPWAWLSGPLSGLITRTIPDMTDSFNQFADGLKTAAEATPGDPSRPS